MSYQAEYRQSIENSEAFWLKKAGIIDWYKLPKQPLSQDSEGFHRWYADGELNTSYLALDYHVSQGRGDQTAIIYDSPVTNTIKHITYSELTNEVAHFAGALRNLGVKKGDRVVIYMPMVPEAAIAMLACARLGAVHSVVFGGFAPHELTVRIDDARPKIIVSASCGIEVDKVLPYKPLLDDAIEQSEHKPSHCVILQRPQIKAELFKGRDLDWHEIISSVSPADPVSVKGTDPLYILYTSGTTGKPKGVVRDNGGHAVALRYSMEAIYDVKAGDVYWAASDVGWVVGHSYIVYAPLLTGCTTVIYEGKPVKTPDAGALWRVCAEHNVKIMFTAPTAFRAVRKEDPDAELLKQYDLSKLERLYLAGERLDPPTYHWLVEKTGLPLIDHWWQTETGWPIAANPVGLEIMETKPGSATVAVPGFNIKIIDESGEESGPNKQGFVAIQLPLPPGCLPTIWGDSDRFRRSYLEQFPGYYVSGDGGYIDDDGYLFIMGRTDDVINVAGHRLSTGEMEEIVASHNAVAECAVIGVQDQLKGQLPFGLIVLKDNVTAAHQSITTELVQLVREKIGAIACFRNAVIVERLPKTRSGKILRKVLRQIVDEHEYTVPSTIDDPAILDEITQQLYS